MAKNRNSRKTGSGGRQPETMEGRMLSAQHALDDPAWRQTLLKAAKGCETLKQLADLVGISRPTLVRWLSADETFKAQLSGRMERPIKRGRRWG